MNVLKGLPCGCQGRRTPTRAWAIAYAMPWGQRVIGCVMNGREGDWCGFTHKSPSGISEDGDTMRHWWKQMVWYRVVSHRLQSSEVWSVFPYSAESVRACMGWQRSATRQRIGSDKGHGCPSWAGPRTELPAWLVAAKLEKAMSIYIHLL